MRRLRWQLLVVVLALAAIGALLLSQQPEILPGIQEPEPTAAPATGGVYSEALLGSLSRLNPLLDFFNPADRDVDRLLYSGLVSFDDRGNPVADLADSWGISEDGTVYNFSIREKAVWHDGNPVTSDDVLFTIELLKSDSLPVPPDLREFWNQIEVSALNDKVLQFRLPEAFAPFLDYLTFGVLPRHLLENLTPEQIVDAPFNLNPVGSGPFQFDTLIVENREIKGVVLKAFKEFYGGRPYLDQVVFRYYPDSAAGLQAYKQNQVMGISQVTPDVLPEALETPGLSLYSARLPRLSLVYLNLGDPELSFFQDAAVRHALLTGINRQWIVDRLLKGQALIADGPIFPQTWAYYDGTPHPEFNPDQAVSMLKEAGYTIPEEGGSVRAKEGVKLQFELVYPEGMLYDSIAQQIQKDWESIGVGVTLKPVPYNQLIDDYLTPRKYQAALVDLNLARSPDPDPYPFWHQEQATNGQNYSKWDDRQASEFLEQARVLVEPEERLRRYRNFQVRFATEMPALPLYYPVYSYAVSSALNGVTMGPLFDTAERFATIARWHMQKERVQSAPSTQAAP